MLAFKNFFVVCLQLKKVFQPSFHQNKNLSQIKILEVFQPTRNSLDIKLYFYFEAFLGFVENWAENEWRVRKLKKQLSKP